MIEKTVSGWWYAGGGVVIGVALGALLAGPDEDEGPSLLSRLLAKIPRRVKIGGAVGAVKGAASAAVHR